MVKQISKLEVVYFFLLFLFLIEFFIGETIELVVMLFNFEISLDNFLNGVGNPCCSGLNFFDFFFYLNFVNIDLLFFKLGFIRLFVLALNLFTFLLIA